MNKTKISMLFVVALLLSQPMQVKCLVKEGIALCAVVVAIFGYVRYNENNKSEAEKFIESGANLAKDGIDKTAQIIKDEVKKA